MCLVNTSLSIYLFILMFLVVLKNFLIIVYKKLFILKKKHTSFSIDACIYLQRCEMFIIKIIN